MPLVHVGIWIHTGPKYSWLSGKRWRIWNCEEKGMTKVKLMKGALLRYCTSAAAHLWANSIRFCLFLIGKFYSNAMLGLLIPILLLNLVVQSIFVLAWKSKQQRAKKNWRQKWWNQKLCRYKGICCRYVPTTYAGFIQANTSFNRIWLVNLRSRLERQAPTVSSFVT